MFTKKKIIFISGTRADYGKIKPLITSVYSNVNFEVSIIVTGMHLSKLHGYTYYQIKKDFPKINIFKFINYQESMDKILAVTILGINLIIKKHRPDLIVAHGDRPEALASAIVGHLNNILVCHIEGGEISGTVDESIRHATSKLAHTHFVSNLKAKKILVQLGEIKKNIFVIGSPEVDVMLSNKLPTILEVKKKYEIYFDNYSIVILSNIVIIMQMIGA
jgi:UDP-N-acetylglucosamine 2-epimerase (hydrolysing)